MIFIKKTGHYLDDGFLLEKINLENEIKYEELKLNESSNDTLKELFKKVNYLIERLKYEKISEHSKDCSILYNNDLSEIKIIDFFSINMFDVNIFNLENYLNKNWKFNKKIRESLMTIIKTSVNHHTH